MGAKNSEFDALGKAAGAVAARFMKGEAVEAELLRLNTALLENLLKSMVAGARRNGDARLEGKDAESLLAIVNRKIFKALKAKQYKEREKYKSWATTIAMNAFLDYIKWRRGRQLPQDDDYEPVDRLLPVGEPLSEDEREMTPHSPDLRAWDDDPEASLLDRDIFNLVFGAVRGISNDDEAAVFVSRVILAHPYSTIAEMLDLSPSTPKNYYFRAVEDMESVVREDPDWGDLPVRGLVEVVAARFELRPSDIEALAPEMRHALEIARQPGMELSELADRMGVSEMRARKLLREAVVALARTRIRRAERPKGVGEAELAAWLWDEVEEALAAYPKRAARTRSCAGKADELLAISELAIHYLYVGPGATRVKSLGELVREHLDSSRRKEAAAAFGLPEHKVLGLIADRLPPEELTPELLGRISKYLKLPPKAVEEASRVPPRRGPVGRTRGGTADEASRQEHLLRRVLGR